MRWTAIRSGTAGLRDGGDLGEQLLAAKRQQLIELGMLVDLTRRSCTSSLRAPRSEAGRT